MKKSYNNPSGITMNVTDLTAFQTSEGITNEFVKQTKSNIIDTVRNKKTDIFEQMQAEKDQKIAALLFARRGTLIPAIDGHAKLMQAMQYKVLEKVIVKGTGDALKQVVAK